MLTWTFEDTYEKYRIIKKTYSCFRCTSAQRRIVELKGSKIPYIDSTITLVRDIDFVCDNKVDDKESVRNCTKGDRDFCSGCDRCSHASMHVAIVNPKCISLPAKDSKNLTVKHELFHCDKDPDGVYNRGYVTCRDFKMGEQQDDGEKNK